MNRAHVRALIILSLVVVSLLMPSSARAECWTPGRSSLDEPSVELVFSGLTVGMNVVAKDGVRVTFNVDRVWKGSVPKKLDLYIAIIDSEMPRFEFGRRYVAFATKMNDRSRQGVGLTANDGVAFRPIQCGALAYDSDRSAVRDMGEGQPPN
jgi:hypothetical protein